MIPFFSSRLRRGGTTLTEVLMALLVMGIGLVSVATLFPLSLLRSVEATKLTNATLTRINADARIRASVWRDGFGNPIRRAVVEDPDRDGDVLEHSATKFVFDPLGAWTLVGDGVAPAINTVNPGAVNYNATTFGDFDGDGAIDPGSPIKRFTFGLGTAADPGPARSFVTLPDSFVNVADVLGGAVSVSGTTLTITGPDMSEFAGQPVRVTFLDADGKSSVVREGSIGGAFVQVTGASTIDIRAALPSGVAANLGRVTVESFEQRYTWIATVRRYGVKPSVTIAVFFRRSFSPDDEKVYLIDEPAGSYNEFEMASADADGNGQLDRPAGMKVGGYMFDVATFRWLKIASITDVKSSGLIRFTTDPDDVDPSPQPRFKVPVMFPNNVVEAYTLKKD